VKTWSIQIMVSSSTGTDPTMRMRSLFSLTVSIVSRDADAAKLTR
jgi:hypothetical protein